MTRKAKPTTAQPLDTLRWVKPETLHANDYNPNRVFPPELALLKVSLLADGWTQPIVVKPDGEIVDGFHRWTLGSNDEDVRALTGGLVPVVTLQLVDGAHQKASTVRHNRARGQHGILHMGEIVRAMRDEGRTDDQICTELGMELEEIERLSDMTPSPDKAGKESFGRGWVPDPEA